MKPADAVVPPRRHPEVLVAPIVVFLAVVALLSAARWMERVPIHPPACQFQAKIGLPCPGCGGTRAMKSMARGEVIAALRYNPAVVLGIAAACLWLARAWVRYLGRAVPATVERQNSQLKRAGAVVFILLAANWLYLLCFLN